MFITKVQDTILEKIFLVGLFVTDVQRILLWIPVALGVGISFYFGLKQEPPIGMGVFFVLISLCLAKLGSFRPLFFLVISLTIGFLAATLRTEFVGTIMLNEPIKNCIFVGTVDFVEEKPTGSRVILKEITTKKNIKNFPTKVRLALAPGVLRPEIGQTIEAAADFFSFSEPISLTGFDFRRDAFFKGLGATGRLKSWYYSPFTEKKESWFSVIKEVGLPLKLLRTTLTLFLKKTIGGEEGAIAAALVTGDRSGISETVKQNFVDAGLAHLLAISGLHLSLVAGLFFVGLRRFLCFFPVIAGRYHLKKVVAFLVIPLLFFYLLISGSGVPAQRAFIMTTVVMIGVIIDRPALSIRLVAIAATLILLVFPESLISPSFQLSFSAVLALVAAYEGGWMPLRQWSMEGGSLRKMVVYSIGLIGTTTIATLATTPFTIYIFNQLTLQSVLGNLIAIPLTSVFVMPFLFLTALSFMWGGSFFLAQGANLSLKVLIDIAHKVASLPGAGIFVATPPFLFIVFITFGGLWICLVTSKHRWWGAGAIGMGIFCTYCTSPPDILIGCHGQVMAYGLEKTLYISSSSQGRFLTKSWAKERGVSNLKPWPSSFVTYTKNHQKFLLVSSYKGHYKTLKNLSYNYSIILSPYYIPTIFKEKKIVIDRSLLKSTALIWVEKEGVTIKWVKDALGNRPWVTSN